MTLICLLVNKKKRIFANPKYIKYEYVRKQNPERFD